MICNLPLEPRKEKKRKEKKRVRHMAFPFHGLSALV
jgi:hypothetical protein